MLKITTKIATIAIITASLTPTSAFAIVATPSARPNLPQSISNATVLAKSGTTLTLRQDTDTFTAQTSTNTRFRRKFWGTSNFNEIQVGDTVNVLGKWQNPDQTTLLASFIRDESIQKVNGVFIGTITSISENTWTVETKTHGTQTITTNASARRTNRKNQPIQTSEIQVGHKIRVRGLWDTANNTVTDVTKIKNYSLPIISP